jgi:acetylornithine deacetylase/succinyl-diaminopimelate desuccinylase-like protein
MLPQRALDLACAIQQIPAPTFAEAARAAFLCSQFVELGLKDIEMDDLGNVYGRYPGRAPLPRPMVISAHLDTVFPANTPLTLTRAADRLSGPGIGDNSLGVAALCGLVWAVNGEVFPGRVR